MRTLKLVFGICLMVVFLISCKTIESNVVKVNVSETIYQEGFLNIVEIMQTWNIAPLMGSIGGMPMYGFTNPNLQADIQYVLVLLYMDMPVGYTYLLDGEPFVYFINEETLDFKLLTDTDKEQWKLNFQEIFLLDGI